MLSAASCVLWSRTASRTLVLGPGTAGPRVRSCCRARGAESGYLTRGVQAPAVSHPV